MTTSRKILYIALFAILLVLNGILFMSHQKEKNERKNLTRAIEQMEKKKDQIQLEYNEALKELEMNIDDNMRKDSLVVKLEGNISSQKGEIERILRKSKVSQRELEAARNMISTLRLSGQNLNQQIEQLEVANLRLSKENTNLRETIVAEQGFREELLEETKQLNQDKEVLLEEKDNLSATVAQAKILASGNVSASGVRYKKNGKELNTDNYKKVDKIKVCFDLLTNRVADDNEKEIYLRIVNPEGTTIAIQDLGSGTFEYLEENTTRQYTTMASIPYDKDNKKRYCMFWQQDIPYSPGNYSAEIYNDGYMIGETAFELKSKLF